MSKEVSLLVLAAGLGSRYQGQKQLDPVSDAKETMMEFALYDAVKVGIRKFVFIINDQMPASYKNRLKTILSESGSTAHFVEQTLDKNVPEKYLPKTTGRRKPLGTAHAVFCAKEVIKEPFITTNADDFYGRETFKTAYDWLQKDHITADRYGMLAFKLKNTLSDYGTVSRGICQVDGNHLKGVDEHTKINKADGKLEGINEAGETVELDAEEWVSMNFWMLHPSLFDLTETDLETFLENAEANSTEEFYLPSVVDNGVQKGSIEVEVLPTSEKWFGLTYPEDKAIALKEVAKRKEEGVYPNKLWNLE